MDRIDDAVSRILRVKFTMGLFENPIADFSKVNEVGSQPHRDIVREAVRKSLVLLRNGKQGSEPVCPCPRGHPRFWLLEVMPIILATNVAAGQSVGKGLVGMQTQQAPVVTKLPG